MKNLLCLATLCFFSLSLLSAQKVDKTAATRDIIRGFEDGFETAENKKYLSPNLKVVWPGGNSWPDGSGANAEAFWEMYSSRREFFKSEFSDVVIRELGNETYTFLTWKSTIRKEENHPEWIGTSAVGPLAYRMVWGNDQIREWHVFFDAKSREEQHAKGKE